MHIFGNAEIFIRIEKGFACQFALSVLIVATLVPHRIRAVCVLAYIVGNIGNNKLGFGDVVDLVILEMVVEKLGFLECHLIEVLGVIVSLVCRLCGQCVFLSKCWGVRGVAPSG